MKLRNIVLILAALMICVGVNAQKKKIKLAPGASCYVWSENTQNKPDNVPNGGFVDEANFFDALNIRVCEELRNIESGGFIMWEGYLQVHESGDYRFTLNRRGHREFYLKIFLNNKPLFERFARGANTMTAQANLKRGFVKVRVYFNPKADFGWGDPGTGSRTGFNLKFAPKMAMKMKDINPAGLYHTVSSER